MLKEISKNIWQFSFDNFGSLCYLIKDKKILIDTSSPENKDEIIEDLRRIKINPEDIQVVLLTHFHYDHIGNLLIFKNTEFYASEQEIKDLTQNPKNTILAPTSQTEIAEIKNRLKPITNFKDKDIEIIESPGHTKGSLCFYMPKEQILFSGDTIFNEGGVGRTDLPTSSGEKDLYKSIETLQKLKYKILCPGH